jgi:Protein of unknown function (DUF1499)
MKRRGRLVRIAAWLALVAGVAALGAALYIHLPGGKPRLEASFAVPAYAATDFATLRKTSKPNQYLVLPPGLGVEEPDHVAPAFDMPAARLAELWRTRVATGTDIAERRWDAATLTGEYVERSKLMRYPDLITVHFQPQDATRSTLAIYSRSVYGYSDRGVNQRRVRQWLDRLSEAARAG